MEPNTTIKQKLDFFGFITLFKNDKEASGEEWINPENH